ncbi:hypothetical protein M0805_002436 [Coniferiporia weirii]|nr:hypothetical protein M0805_002436 [Coniferiporia weirii]
MSSPQNTSMLSSSPSRSIRVDIAQPHPSRSGSDDRDGTLPVHPRRSPTLVRTVDPNDPDARERQRSLDVDSAMQLSRARSGSVAVTNSYAAPPHSPGAALPMTAATLTTSPERMPMSDSTHFPFLPPIEPEDSDGDGLLRQHLSQAHEPSLLVSLNQARHNEAMGGLPLYQASSYRSSFDFGLMETFADEEKQKLGLVSPLRTTAAVPFSRPPAFGSAPDSLQQTESVQPDIPGPQDLFIPADVNDSVAPDSSSARFRQRKLSLSNTTKPRTRRQGGKMALFEGSTGAPPPSLGIPGASGAGRFSPMPSFENLPRADGGGQGRLPPPVYSQAGHERPYRFSFYSNSLSATIHSRSLSELPAEGQSFEDLFSGSGSRSNVDKDELYMGTAKPRLGESSNGFRSNKRDGNNRLPQDDDEPCAWWLDVMSPTDEEMKLLSKVFSIHPLTTEDIQMEETREKIELFRNYYLVCFRSFDQDPYSPTYLEPLNMYIIVFREGTLSFHFRPTPHPQNVRRRIKQLKDYINVTSDWISYALIDDITDAFGPLIQNIEYEVDSIDELVLILKEAEQSDMLRRIGTCRKKVMGLLRLMGNKADVVKGLAKRCNENWSIAPKSDIGLYLSDIQDHLITMTQNLNHYEKILSRSHSNYLAQISIEMTDANNQINDVLSKLTALGTVLIPMNLVTGLWGMNVHVPGQSDSGGYTWFVSIIGGLIGFALIGGFMTYKLVRR